MHDTEILIGELRNMNASVKWRINCTIYCSTLYNPFLHSLEPNLTNSKFAVWGEGLGACGGLGFGLGVWGLGLHSFGVVPRSLGFKGLGL